MIGEIEGKGHGKTFARHGVSGARILRDEPFRRLSIIPVQELEKLSSAYELCFAEWPQTADPDELAMLDEYEWNAEKLFFEGDREAPLRFLSRTGSGLLYFWYDGRSRYLLEPEPHFLIYLLRQDLNHCAALSAPDSLLPLSEQQILQLAEPDDRYTSTGSRYIRVEPEAVRIRVFTDKYEKQSQSREFVFRPNETEIGEWEPATIPRGVQV